MHTLQTVLGKNTGCVAKISESVLCEKRKLNTTIKDLRNSVSRGYNYNMYKAERLQCQQFYGCMTQKLIKGSSVRATITAQNYLQRDEGVFLYSNSIDFIHTQTEDQDMTNGGMVQ